MIFMLILVIHAVEYVCGFLIVDFEVLFALKL